MQQRAMFIMLRKFQGAWRSTAYRICIGVVAFARLGLLACARLLPKRTNRLEHSINKWLAIFRWAIGSGAAVRSLSGSPERLSRPRRIEGN